MCKPNKPSKTSAEDGGESCFGSVGDDVLWFGSEETWREVSRGDGEAGGASASDGNETASLLDIDHILYKNLSQIKEVHSSRSIASEEASQTKAKSASAFFEPASLNAVLFETAPLFIEIAKHRTSDGML